MAAASLPAAGVISSLFGSLPAAADAGIDHPALRSRWLDVFTGRQEIDTSDPRYAVVLERRRVAAADARTHLDHGAGRSAVFTDAPLDTNDGVMLTYRRLRSMGYAWATPGQALFHDPTLVAEIIEGLRTANQFGYNPSIPEYGNWWTWEQGVTECLSSTMMLVYEHLTATDIANYCAAIDFYVPDPWYKLPEGEGRKLSVGTGRISLCRSIIVRALADGDTAKLEHARAGLAVGWELVTSGDGFYADGSFITHTTVAYTGSYGIVMPVALAKLFALLEPVVGAGADHAEFFDLIDRAFLPVVHRGQVLDSTRGRAISRAELRSRTETANLLEALVDMSAAVDATTASRWLGRCKGWLADLGDDVNLTSVTRVSAIRRLEASPAPALPDPAGVHLFGSMDRVVFRQPGWGLAIAGASSRIALYECGNDENPRGFHTGAGMTTLYNDDVTQYDDEFWPTVDWYRLPGTTTDQTRLPDETGLTFGRALCPGEWTGGSAVHRDDPEAAVVFAQDLRGLGETEPLLRARKYWLGHDGRVVALGSGIRSTSGAQVETIVENRNLHAEGSNRLLVDGDEQIPGLDTSRTLHSPRWAHLEGVGGYLFEPGTVLKMRRETRSGAWSTINGTGPTEVLQRRFLTVWIWHGTNPYGHSYGYVLLPGATAEQTAAAATSGGHEVLVNDELTQAARIGDVRGFAFWQANSVDGVTTDGPGTVLIKDADGIRTVAVTPHGVGGDALTVELPSGVWSTLADDGEATVATRGDTISITVPRSSTPREFTVVFHL